MKLMMVQYRVKADRAEENARYIRDVFSQLQKETPPGLRYCAFRLEDGVTFVHIVSNEAPNGSDPLRELPAFRAFSAGIKDRCEQPPTFTNLSEVGAYRMFGEADRL
ncbi:MAG TPA: hypothetical protein VGQ52_20615 [Gemmatimonadaceae bacterium]|jgi:hypothetical protein|nr:hypothetical protein [Gemmatimonadaceae bacterium]